MGAAAELVGAVAAFPHVEPFLFDDVLDGLGDTVDGVGGDAAAGDAAAGGSAGYFVGVWGFWLVVVCGCWW